MLRTSERARNIHALVSVRDDGANDMARVAAVKTLEQIDHVEAARGGSGEQVLPGLVITIVNTTRDTPTAGPVIDGTLRDDDER